MLFGSTRQVIARIRNMASIIRFWQAKQICRFYFGGWIGLADIPLREYAAHVRLPQLKGVTDAGSLVGTGEGEILYCCLLTRDSGRLNPAGVMSVLAVRDSTEHHFPVFEPHPLVPPSTNVRVPYNHRTDVVRLQTYRVFFSRYFSFDLRCAWYENGHAWIVSTATVNTPPGMRGFDGHNL